LGLDDTQVEKNRGGTGKGEAQEVVPRFGTVGRGGQNPVNWCDSGTTKQRMGDQPAWGGRSSLKGNQLGAGGECSRTSEEPGVMPKWRPGEFKNKNGKGRGRLRQWNCIPLYGQ